MKNYFVLAVAALMCLMTACKKDNGSEPSGDQTIKLSETSITLDKGAEKQLTATAEPAGTITWSSSNNSVATVSNSGLVVANGEGKATITAKVNGASATCEVTVVGSSITDPSLEGDSYYLFNLAEAYANKIPKEKIVKDYRPSETVELQIWENNWYAGNPKTTLTEGIRAGKDYYGGTEEWICLKQSEAAWNDGNGPIGAAGWRVSTEKVDLTGTDDSYVFYCKYKNADNAKILVGFWPEEGEPVYYQLPATSSSEWVVFEKSLKDMGYSFDKSFDAPTNVFSLKFESAQVSTVNFGAAFIYKKKN